MRASSCPAAATSTELCFRMITVRASTPLACPPLAGVEVVLDGVRFTRTDSSGRFRFDDVPHGRHLVEARLTLGRPTFFTTPSPALSGEP